MKKINFDLSGSFEANMKRFDSKGYPANKSWLIDLYYPKIDVFEIPSHNVQDNNLMLPNIFDASNA